MNKPIYKKGIIVLGILMLFLPFINTVNASEQYEILVRTPKGGETLYLNHAFTIRWDPPEPFEHVSIRLFQDVSLLRAIDPYTENSGEFLWVISGDDYNTGDNYRIKIIAIGSGSDEWSGFSGLFSIREKRSLTETEQFIINSGVFLVVLIIIVLAIIIYDFKNKKRIKTWLIKIKNWRKTKNERKV